MAERGRNYTWKGEEYKKKIKRGLNANLDLAAIFLVRDIKQSFGDTGVAGGRSGATKAQRAANRSKPGGPPNVDTGHLKRNIGYDTPTRALLVRRIGTGIGNAEHVGYAIYLELGTSKMDARPFLRTALARNRAKLRQLLGRRV